MTVIRGRLLDKHPELNAREFDQDLVRSRFRVIFRKSAFMIVSKRNELLKKQPELDLPRIKKIDDNKIRLIVHGNEGTVIRVALLRFYLDQENV